jgi:oligoendopeptidase F
MKKATDYPTEWNLKLLFESDDDLRMNERRKKIEQSTKAFVDKWKHNKNYLSNPNILKEALDEYELWAKNSGVNDDLNGNNLTGDEGYYFWLRSQQDQNDPKIKAKMNNIHDFTVNIENQMQFFQLSLAKITQKHQRIFLHDEKLKKYKYYLARVFAEAKYVLDDEIEKVLNLKASVAYSNWVKMTSSFLAKEEREVIDEKGIKAKKTLSDIYALLRDTDKKVRDSAAEAFADILQEYVDVAEYELNSVLQNKKIDDELRGAKRPDEIRHVFDDVDSEIIDSLRAAVAKRFDISKKYYALKAKLFGVKQLKYHERGVPYGEFNKKYTYSEAVNLVQNSLHRLDSSFSDIFMHFINDGRIDAFPRKGKRSGAFCVYNLITQPVYIMLNHTDTLQDVLTMAHEVGHGINNELMRKQQHSLYFSTPVATAEVASNFIEDFVLHDLTMNLPEKLRLSVLMYQLDNLIASIFRQIACYNFEFELHNSFRERGYLSNQEIGKIFQKNMRAYMGDAVEQTSGQADTFWVYWPHIRDFFYVYSYASGLLISKALQNNVKQNPRFVENVKDFLSAGRSDSPRNIFLRTGIDISKSEFWDSGLDEIEILLVEAEQLAQKQINKKLK